eukprot:UN00082
MLAVFFSLFYVVSKVADAIGNSCPSSFECAQDVCNAAIGAPQSGAPCRYTCPDNIPYIDQWTLPGQKVYKNPALISQNRRFVAIIQGDNNFCVNELNPDGSRKRGLWCAMNDVNTGTSYLVYQTDNNVCVYGDRNWCAMSHNAAETPGRLIMHNDGNLCAYEDDPTSPAVLWCSGTAQGLIPILNVPDPIGTIEVSVTFLIIVGFVMLLYAVCATF